MTIYRVSTVDRNAMIHYNTDKTRKAVENAMYEIDGEMPETVAEFENEAEAEAFARTIDSAPFTRFDPRHVCWKAVIVTTVAVDEDGDEEEEDYYETGAGVDEIMAFVESLEEEEDSGEEDEEDEEE